MALKSVDSEYRKSDPQTAFSLAIYSFAIWFAFRAGADSYA
jgi:hypothetical protein